MPKDRIDKAIEAFEDETSDLTMGERISNLRMALTWSAFDRIKRIQQLGTKAPESAELEYKQVESQKQFKIIEMMYNSQLRHNKLSGKANEDGMDKDWLRKIKESNTLGSIVVDMKEKIA